MTGESRTDPEARRRLPALPLWAALVLMVVALVMAALILSRVAEPLYRLVFSRGAPAPDWADEIERGEPERGAPYRIYRADRPGREVAAFYEAEGGTCVYTAAPPTGAGEVPPERGRSVARCMLASSDAARGGGWEVYIAEGYSAEEGPTIFRVYEY